MKVGILTFHFAPNYGAALQAWGLQTALRRLGHETEFIDYIPTYMRSRISPFRGWGVRQGSRFLKVLGHRLQGIKRRRAFAEFRKRKLVVSRRLRTRGELREYCGGFDALVVGSDQVWNMRWMRKCNVAFDDTYFLGFLPDYGGPRRVAYAPCFGDPAQPEDLMEQAGQLLRRFDAVGMRNEFGNRILANAGVRCADAVVDPAFLLNEPHSSGDRKGIVVYAVSDNTVATCSTVADRMSSLLKSPIYHLSSEFYIRLLGVRAEVRATEGPEAWLRAISNASFVCSESFHGVVFAMAFNRPFCAVTAGLRSHRVTDLLTKYGLMDRMITDASDSVDCARLLDLNMDYRAALERDIERSVQFLKDAIH